MITMMKSLLQFQCLVLLLLSSTCWAFQPPPLQPSSATAASAFRHFLDTSAIGTTTALSSSASEGASSSPAPPQLTIKEQVRNLKSQLLQTCTSNPKASLADILGLVNKLEEAAETVGLGQSSSLSGLLNGDWELVYSPDDETRSSPFFWAFRKAFPDNSDQIFGITDSIPSPIKDVGPAKQHIELDTENMGGTGKLVSRVKVATLGGVATSIMTTRATIMGVDGVDGVRLQIDTTKPEDSTIVKLLTGPLYDTVNKQLPAFPSGQALEQAAPGSSTVTMRTTFCDDELRISRNDERPNKDVFVWKRAGFVKTNVV